MMMMVLWISGWCRLSRLLSTAQSLWTTSGQVLHTLSNFNINPFFSKTCGKFSAQAAVDGLRGLCAIQLAHMPAEGSSPRGQLPWSGLDCHHPCDCDAVCGNPGV